MPPIFVKIVLLSQLFSDKYLFNLPWYQRAYAWGTEHAASLLEDVREACKADEWYHLGSIILAKSKRSPESEIVDGQQRIVTLTMLFAVLRDLTTDVALRAALNERIWVTAKAGNATSVLGNLRRHISIRGGLAERSQADLSGEVQATARLSPDDTITEVLRTFVQEDGATLKAPSAEQDDEHNESQTRVVANRNALRQALQDVDQKELSNIARHLLDRCYVDVKSLEDPKLAATIYKKAQTRGMDLEAPDLSKVSILNHVEPEAREDCAEIWSSWSAELGLQEMEFLLRRLYETKCHKAVDGSLETELIAAWEIENNAKAFITDTLAPKAELYAQMRKFSIGEGKAYDAANRRLQYLSLVSSRRWTGPALQFLDAHQGRPDEIEEFLFRLERFASIHMIAHTDTRPRDTAIYEIIKAIDKGNVLSARSPLNLSKKLIDHAVGHLRAPNFINKKHYKTAVLRRINGIIEGDDKVFKMPIASAEHIVPKGAGKRSKWCADFSARNKTVSEWCQRLGNGTLLSPKDNSLAGNNDLIPVKRDIYRKSGFALTRLLASEEEWDDRKIQERTDWMIDLLLKSWGLKK